MLKDIIGLSEEQLIGFLLVFIRITALMTIAPFFGNKALPRRVRIFLSLLLAITLLPMIKSEPHLASLTLPALFPFVVKEVAIGVLLGFVAKFFFESFQFAGHLVSRQMGLAMAELIDPESGSPVTPIGNLFSFVAIMMFLGMNGHHLIISALYRSFEVVPLASKGLIHSGAKTRLITLFNDLFTMGLKLAAPTIVILFLIEFSMGIMARLAPQMNIFFIGLPIRLGVGLLVVVISLPVFYLFFTTVFASWKRDLNGILIYF